jgi:cyclase
LKRIIPAIDLYNNKVVRLMQGDFDQLAVYSIDPLKTVENFMKKGVQYIHLIDLNGVKSGIIEKSPNYDLITSIIKKCKKWGVKVQLGGGIRSEETIKKLISSGLEKVILGSLPFDDERVFLKIVEKFNENILVALDVLNDKIRVKGWTQDTKCELETQLRFFEDKGISSFVITDISRDGTLRGPNIELYKKLSALKKSDSIIIASGGIKIPSDVKQVLKYANGVIIGKALYNHNISHQNLESLVLNYSPTNLVKRVIPCLDVKDGRVVKGVNFNNLKDSGDPVELAKIYNSEGADELVFLDISATLEERESMMNVIKEVAEEVYIPFTVGGGIRNLRDISKIINAGAEKACINTAAFTNPELITLGAQKFGSQCIVVAIDVKRVKNGWEVYIKSGTEATGIDAILWTKNVVKRGAGEILVTSMDQDGTQSGYDLGLIRALSQAVPVPIIASGGAGNLDHFYQAIMNGAEAVLAASLFHKKIIAIRDLKSYLRYKDIRVRI